MRRIIATAVIGALATLAHLAPAHADGPGEPPAADPSARQCIGMFAATSKDRAVADDLMAGRLTMTDFPTWDLPADPTWAEDPYVNPSWQFRLHNLTWLDPLRRVGLATDDEAMLARYRFLVSDWIGDNPFTDRARHSHLDWYDMSVGLRGIGLTCAGTVDGDAAWHDTLAAARAQHAAVLADPDEYAGVGNHALWQDMGLLALGCGADDSGWRDLAVDRSSTLLGTAVDSEGVTDEGSVIYQYLNHTWWKELAQRLQGCGLPTPGLFDRIDLMPDFIAQATMPNGDIVPFGDANAIARVGTLPGTAAQYASTQGRSATHLRPDQLFTVYRRGYVFSRTGWFDTQTSARQGQAAMRFGPSLSTAVHGHQDLGSINYFAGGKHLLWQPGQWGGAGGPQRAYVRSRASHNVIDVPGLRYDVEATAPLTHRRSTSTIDLVTMRTNALKGATWRRTMIHVKKPGFLVVDDRVSQGVARTVVQRWNLEDDRAVARGTARIATSGDGTDLVIAWAGRQPRLSTVKGRTTPMMGWRSKAANQFTPSPVVEAAYKATSVRLTAVIVPRPAGVGSRSIKVVRTRTTSTERSVDVQIGRRTYRVTFDPRSATVKEIRR